jgi:hypothetical protein
LHTLSVSLSNYSRKLDPFKTLANIERVKGFGRKSFEGGFVILAKGIEEIMDSPVNLGPGINRSRAVGL